MVADVAASGAVASVLVKHALKNKMHARLTTSLYSVDMRRPSISAAIRNAVLVALAADACGTSIAPSSDAGEEQVPTDATMPVDAALSPDADPGNDAGDLDALTTIDVPLLPLPDGCIVTGKPDGFAPCGYTEDLSDYNACTIDHDANTQEAAVCFLLCDPTEPDCIYYDLGDSGGSILTCGPGCIGRLQRSGRHAYETCAPLEESAADFLARASSLEAASVDSFHVLAVALDHHGARDLAKRARRAAHDEVRHSRITARLARAVAVTGTVTETVAETVTGTDSHSVTEPRTIFEIAIENAEEGCVRETFGAALAVWQAENARDPNVRDAMREIARDEMQHAELGWKIHAWARTKLNARERLRVEIARKNAVTAMRRDLGTSLDEASRDALGLPDRTRALALFDALTTALA